MSELTEAERRAIHYALDFGHPLSDVDAAVERIIATRLAAAEARAEAAEAVVESLADEWDRTHHESCVCGDYEGLEHDNPFRAALVTAADPDTPAPTRWERA